MQHVELGPLGRLGAAILVLLASALFRVRVAGESHVPASGAVVAGNHVSALDGALLGIVIWGRRRRVTRFLVAAEFFRRFGWVLRAYRQIPLRRGAGDDGALEAAISAVRDGALAGIYPEGRVNPDPEGGFQRGRTGVARIALGADAPVVPVAVWGTQLRWPRPGLRLSLPARPVVAFVFGAAIHLEGDGAARSELQRETDRVMHAIADLLPDARALAGPT